MRPVVSASLALGLLLVAAPIAPAQNGAWLQARATFRSTVDLVTLHVTVTDDSGRYVADLRAPEFKVFENGRPQELHLFERGGFPLAVMLFLDISSSMQSVFGEAQEAAIEFLQRLEGQDIASVVGFEDRVDILQPFTADRAALERAVRQARARGGTRLYNALYVGLTELGKSTGADADHLSIPRRRVAVLLTDGRDTASVVSFERVLDFAKRSDIAIYAIRLRGSTPPHDDDLEPEFVLNQLARQTGGRAFLTVRDGKDLRPVYGDIRTELARQYALGYVSNDPRRDGRFRHLSVQVTRPQARARTRLGYVAPLTVVSARPQ
jgi:Ca-activated chloride channel homolog